MLKSHAGKKILQIMEKTTVDFVLVASSIYHYSFFLDPPMVMPDLDPLSDLRQSAPRLLGIYCCGCSLQLLI